MLAIAPFRRLWIGQLVSVLGDFLAVFAVFTVATYNLHATPPQLAGIMVAYMLPMAVVSPLAGVLVDRWSVRRTMILSDLLRGAIASLLLVATGVYQIYAILFALSTVSSFFVPSQSVLLRRIVPQDGLMAANALMAQVMQVTMILSPALAGVAVATVGPSVCFWFDVASFCFSAWMISRIEVEPVPAAARTIEGIFSELTSGLRFIFTHADISFVMIAMTLAMFAVRCFSALMAVWARDVLKVGPAIYGSLSSAVGIGMICATQFVIRFGAHHSKQRMVVSGLSVAALFVGLVAAFPGTIITFCGMFGMGLGLAFVFIPSQTLFQQATPQAMLGRVSSGMMSSLAMIQVVALLLSGSFAAVIGIRNVYFASAAMLGVVALAGWHWLGRKPSS